MINDIRINKINDLIKKELSKIIINEIKDPRLNLIYISYVKTNKNLYFTKVYFTSLINENNEYLLFLLNKSKNFFRYQLSKKIDIYMIPKINFYIDNTIQNTIKIDSILKKINIKNENKDNDIK